MKILGMTPKTLIFVIVGTTLAGAFYGSVILGGTFTLKRLMLRLAINTGVFLLVWAVAVFFKKLHQEDSK